MSQNTVSTLRFAAIFAFSGGCFQAAAVPGVWETHGPHGGAIYDVQVDTVAPGNLYATAADGQFLRSADGGVNWQLGNNGLITTAATQAIFAVDRDGLGPMPQSLYAFDPAGRLFVSLDRAASWGPTGYAAPSQTTPNVMAEIPHSSRLMIATRAFGMFVASNDDNSAFTAVSGFPTGLSVISLAFDPNVTAGSPARILAGVDDVYGTNGPSLYRSVDGGATWTGVLTDSATPMVTPRATSISFGASMGGGLYRVYAMVNNRLWRSDDSGATWALTATTVGGSTVYVATPRSLLAHPTVVSTVYIGSEQGVLISSNSGATSSTLGTGLTSNPSLPSGAGGVVNAILAHPSFPASSTLWVGTDNAGFFRSVNLGTTWSTQNTGMQALNTPALALQPGSGFTGAMARVYAGSGSYEPESGYQWPAPVFYRSVNAGNTWAISNAGLDACSLNAIVVDPTTATSTASTHVYAGGRCSHAQTMRNGGLYKSVDGGTSWAAIDSGLPLTIGVPDISGILSMALDPRSCTSPPSGSSPCTSGPLQTVYATAPGRVGATAVTYRVIKSVDAGGSWSAIDASLPVTTDMSGAPEEWVAPTQIIVNPQNTQHLYLATRAIDVRVAAVPPTIANGVYRSTDGGSTWARMGITGLPLVSGSMTTVHDILALAIHPTDPNTLWISTYDPVTLQSAVYRTVSGGASWELASSGLNRQQTQFRALLADTASPGTLYVTATGVGGSGNPGGVYKSVDGGATWRSISVGLSAHSVFSVAIDPVDRQKLFAATNQGIWTLAQITDTDHDGIADGDEDAAPNGGDGNGDMVQDRVQPDVGSGVVLSVFPAAACSTYYTADVLTSGCGQLVDTQGIGASSFGGVDYLLPSSPRLAMQYPLDLVRFEIVDCNHAEVEVTFHSAGFDPDVCPDFNDDRWSFRYYGPSIPGASATVAWQDASARSQVVDGTTWRLTLDANAPGSSYRTEDNSILFIGGPALNTDRILRDGFE